MVTAAAAVLVTDAEPATRGFLEQHLPRDGFQLVGAQGVPDLVLAGNVEVVDRWVDRAAVIVLGRAEADVVDRVRALRRGCDDYVPQPFDYQELVERIRAVLRRAGTPAGGAVVAGPLEIDATSRVVLLHGRPVGLSQKEYALVARLAADPRRVFTKDELLRDVWGYRARARTRTLDSHVSRVRRKLREIDADVALLENVWGVGYRLVGVLADRAAEPMG